MITVTTLLFILVSSFVFLHELELLFLKLKAAWFFIIACEVWKLNL